MNTTTTDRPLPRSYMPEEEKIGMTQNAIYLCESVEAKAAGDEETSWAWLALANLTESSMSMLKSVCGDEFLKSKGFNI
ncbi:hypothetical protein AGMMS49960_20950 [Betaproteobacteria bacterium]|nr:hypothetical protein AGMMS49543_09670 [Betaproteobacteria bacterium]GHU04820.1 hypothetical protein AGMMS49960_20950 [Betaproteobacteria bacterium]GHU16976.1 hypothetical protein AGMMS50243_04380 [Betaproteobacteria bacterium]